MNTISGNQTIPSPTHLPSDFLAHKNECRAVLKPWLNDVLDMAESAGWNRRTAATTLMFLAAAQVTGMRSARQRRTRRLRRPDNTRRPDDRN
jgi:hypothetical protein